MADLLETKQDGVAILTMNRPEARNALSQPMLAALNEALPRLAADPDIGCVVITGSGGAFSNHDRWIDISASVQLNASPSNIFEGTTNGVRRCLSL